MPDPQDQIDRDAIVAWVAKLADPAQKPAALMFGLNRATADPERATPITNRTFPPKRDAGDRIREAEDLVDEFVREARMWSGIEARPQRFTISAHLETFAADLPPRVVAQTTFIVAPPPGVGSSDGMDPRDVVANLQRSLSDAMRFGFSNVQQSADRDAEELRSLRDHVRVLHEQQLAYTLERERILSEKNKRDIEVEEARVRVEALRRGLDVLAGWVSSRLAAPSSRAEPEAFTIDHLLAFCATLTEEQGRLFYPILSAIEARMTAAQRGEMREKFREAARLNGAASAPSAGGSS